ncbi:MAG: Cell shape-determining protein MreC precursor [bacterium ADurb.Bin429]|nr:MAG: Cell shape-determining protein MreC precursor [bacterium ADurb.Bin429]
MSQARLQALEEENRRLRALLALRDTAVKDALIAQVIARDTRPGEEYLVIDKGRGEGVEPHMVVLTPNGVIGQVFEADSHTATLMPLTDAASGIGAVSTRGRAFGVVKGGKGRACRMVYISGTSDIRSGDTIVTSGLSQFFPPGLPIGTVESVEADPALSSRIAVIKPAANPAQAEFVLLIKYAPPGER